MHRRDFLRRAAAAAAGGALTGCAPAARGPAVRTRPRVRWRLVSSFPRSLDTLYGAAEVLARRVKELTGGRFTIRVHQGGEIVPGLQVLDAVQQGTVEMGHAASYYFIGKNPALAFDAAIPFGLTARQQTAWLTEAGGGLQLMRRLFSDFNVINFPGGNTGVQMGGWFRRPVESLADLKGLKMRIPGLGGEVMNRLGVTVQVLAGAEIYPALERGAIDAAEWVGPYDDLKLGFHQVARYYYYPGWWEPGPALSFYVNRDAWRQLPPEYQAAVEAAAAEAARGMIAEYDAKNPPALEKLLGAGVELRPFPEEVLKAARQTIQAILEEQAAKDREYRRIYEQWDQFRKASNRWFGTAERAYTIFVYRA